MLELCESHSGNYSKRFAGDTLNTAIYAKRLYPDMQLAFFSAVGKDPVSRDMEAFWQAEGIDTQFVYHADKAVAGIYLVDTNPSGERSFFYWRKHSAATEMMDLLHKSDAQSSFPHFDMVYFSGISLSILSDDNKNALLALVKTLKAKGSTIIFDPNYRPRMWQSPAHAIAFFRQAYAIADIALPGDDDHETLFGHQSHEEINAYLCELNVPEQIIKCGSQGVYAYEGSQNTFHLPFSPAPVQVDTTAAGDSFAGAYISSRLAGQDIGQAITMAADVAALVVQHPGAIIDKAVFDRLKPEINVG